MIFWLLGGILTILVLLITLILLIIFVLDLLIRYRQKTASLPSPRNTIQQLPADSHQRALQDALPIRLALLDLFMVNAASLSRKIMRKASDDFLYAVDLTSDQKFRFDSENSISSNEENSSVVSDNKMFAIKSEQRMDPARVQWLQSYGARFEQGLRDLLDRMYHAKGPDEMEADHFLTGTDLKMLLKIQKLGLLITDEHLQKIDDKTLEEAVKDPMLLTALQKLTEFILNEYVLRYYIYIKPDPQPAIGNHIRRSVEHTIISLYEQLSTIHPTQFILSTIVQKIISPVLGFIDHEIATWKHNNAHRVGAQSSTKKRNLFHIPLDQQFLEIFEQIHDVNNHRLRSALHPGAVKKFRQNNLPTQPSHDPNHPESQVDYLALLTATTFHSNDEPEHDYLFKCLVVMLSRTMRDEDFDHPILRQAILDIVAEKGVTSILSMLEPTSLRQLLLPYISVRTQIDDKVPKDDGTQPHTHTTNIDQNLAKRDQEYKDRIPKDTWIRGDTEMLLTDHTHLATKRSDWLEHRSAEKSYVGERNKQLINMMKLSFEKMIKNKKNKAKIARAKVVSNLELKKDYLRSLELQKRQLDRLSDEKAMLLDEKQQLNVLIHQLQIESQQNNSFYEETDKSRTSSFSTKNSFAPSRINVDVDASNAGPASPALTQSLSTYLNDTQTASNNNNVPDDPVAVPPIPQSLSNNLPNTASNSSVPLSSHEAVTQNEDQTDTSIPAFALNLNTNMISINLNQLTPAQTPLQSSTTFHLLLPEEPLPPISTSSTNNSTPRQTTTSLSSTPLTQTQSLQPGDAPLVSDSPIFLSSTSSSSLIKHGVGDIDPMTLVNTNATLPSSRNPTAKSSPLPHSTSMQITNHFDSTIVYSLKDIDHLLFHHKNRAEFAFTPELLRVASRDFRDVYLLSQKYLYPRILNPNDWQFMVNILTAPLDLATVHVHSTMGLFDGDKKAFSAFDICISLHKHRWCIRRRFSNLLSLHKALKSSLPPEKYDLTLQNRRFMNFLDGAKVAQERCQDIEHYLNELLRRTPLLTQAVTRWFLQPMLDNNCPARTAYRWDFDGVECIANNSNEIHNIYNTININYGALQRQSISGHQPTIKNFSQSYQPSELDVDSVSMSKYDTITSTTLNNSPSISSLHHPQFSQNPSNPRQNNNNNDFFLDDDTTIPISRTASNLSDCKNSNSQINTPHQPAAHGDLDTIEHFHAIEPDDVNPNTPSIDYSSLHDNQFIDFGDELVRPANHLSMSNNDQVSGNFRHRSSSIIITPQDITIPLHAQANQDLYTHHMTSLHEDFSSGTGDNEQHNNGDYDLSNNINNNNIDGSNTDNRNVNDFFMDDAPLGEDSLLHLKQGNNPQQTGIFSATRSGFSTVLSTMTIGLINLEKAPDQQQPNLIYDINTANAMNTNSSMNTAGGPRDSILNSSSSILIHPNNSQFNTLNHSTANTLGNTNQSHTLRMNSTLPASSQRLLPSGVTKKMQQTTSNHNSIYISDNVLYYEKYPGTFKPYVALNPEDLRRAIEDTQEQENVLYELNRAGVRVRSPELMEDPSQYANMSQTIDISGINEYFSPDEGLRTPAHADSSAGDHSMLTNNILSLNLDTLQTPIATDTSISPGGTDRISMTPSKSKHKSSFFRGKRSRISTTAPLPALIDGPKNQQSTISQDRIPEQLHKTRIIVNKNLANARLVAKNLSKVYPYFTQSAQFAPIDSIIDVHVTDQIRLLMLFYSMNKTLYTKIENTIDIVVDNIVNKEADEVYHKQREDVQSLKESAILEQYIEFGPVVFEDLEKSDSSSHHGSLSPSKTSTSPHQSTQLLNELSTIASQRITIDQHIHSEKVQEVIDKNRNPVTLLNDTDGASLNNIDNTDDLPQLETHYSNMLSYLTDLLQQFPLPHPNSLPLKLASMLESFIKIPSSGELHTSNVLLSFVDQLFNFEESSFMRRRVVWMIKILFQFTGTQTLDQSIKGLVSAESMAGHIDYLVQLLCGYTAPSPDAVSSNHFVDLMKDFINHYAGSAFGGLACETAALKLALLLQSPLLVHHMIYSILDALLLHMFPDLQQEVQYLHILDPLQQVYNYEQSFVQHQSTQSVSADYCLPLHLNAFSPRHRNQMETDKITSTLSPQIVNAMRYFQLGMDTSQLDPTKPFSLNNNSKKKNNNSSHATSKDDMKQSTQFTDQQFQAILELLKDLNTKNAESEKPQQQNTAPFQQTIFGELVDALMKPLGYQKQHSSSNDKKQL